MSAAQLIQIRRTARFVAENAPHVHIQREGVAKLAAEYQPANFDGPRADLALDRLANRDHTLPFVLTLGTLRFGSGYSPKLKKREGLTGQRTLVACLQDRFRDRGPFTSGEMSRFANDEMARLLGQNSADPVQAEYIELTTRALRDFGRLLQERFEGSYTALAESAHASAARFVDLVSTTPYLHDVQRYRGLDTPFLHRAQRMAVDMHAAFGADGLGRFEDLHELAPSSDAVIAHVLRNEGIVVYDEHLTERVDRGEIVPAHSEREVEIRASSILAVDMLVSALRHRNVHASPLDVDLWLRDRVRRLAPRAKLRHRTRTVQY